MSTLIGGETHMDVCGEAETTAEAREQISQATLDLVIADISLGGTGSSSLATYHFGM